MQQQICLFCGNKVELAHVHGHYQCPVCHTNTFPCCDGDNCNTNNFLKEEETNDLESTLTRPAIFNS